MKPFRRKSRKIANSNLGNQVNQLGKADVLNDWIDLVFPEFFHSNEQFISFEIILGNESLLMLHILTTPLQN
jgi:hypothetical protein